MPVLANILALWMPAALKARACREVSADFAAALSAALRSGRSGTQAYRAAARETGLSSGRRLKRDLRLPSSSSGAELAWRIASAASGMKFTVQRTQGSSLFKHTVCPVFSAGGPNLCEDFCLPMVEGLTEAICPSCRVEIAQKASDKRPCVKALLWAAGDVS